MVLNAVCVFAANIAAEKALVEERWDQYRVYYDDQDQELAERSSKVRHPLSTRWFCYVCQVLADLPCTNLSRPTYCLWCCVALSACSAKVLVCKWAYIC